MLEMKIKIEVADALISAIDKLASALEYHRDPHADPRACRTRKPYRRTCAGDCTRICSCTGCINFTHCRSHPCTASCTDECCDDCAHSRTRCAGDRCPHLHT